MHMVVSKLLEKMGLNMSVNHSGENKIDGYPLAPLSPSVRADIQQGAYDLRLMFAHESRTDGHCDS
jgi:ClpP class serine protease